MQVFKDIQAHVQPYKIGKLKSKAAYRSIHMLLMVVQALREWKLVCPKGDLGLVFPNGKERH